MYSIGSIEPSPPRSISQSEFTHILLFPDFVKYVFFRRILKSLWNFVKCSIVLVVDAILVAF
jgi:hypothetical protein